MSKTWDEMSDGERQSECEVMPKRQRICAEWDKIRDQDNLSDEEALNIVAKNANVTYGEAREVLCAGWPK